ncbi:hypothetical protein [Izhakiella australiensis]|uniref:hypothetical protein n=1 Tax=Izhakiella australiensis TaxID=1926881 RepID=UPI0015920AB6|nr:hypothetical protein [Izhakiella australiensis]
MSTFSIIAIPFMCASLTMLVLAATLKNKTFLILGSVFMASSVVNAVLGMSLS